MEQVLGDYFLYLIESKNELPWDICISFGFVTSAALVFLTWLDFTIYSATSASLELDQVLQANLDQIAQIRQAEELFLAKSENPSGDLKSSFNELQEKKVQILRENEVIKTENVILNDSVEDSNKTKNNLKKKSLFLVPLVSLALGATWFIVRTSYKFYIHS